MMSWLAKLPSRAIRRVKLEIFGPPPSPLPPPPRIIAGTVEADLSASPITHLAIAVTFHFNQERLSYLKTIATEYPSLAERVSVYIITNVDEPFRHRQILEAVGQHPCMSVEICVPALLGHPFLLTWSHFAVFRRIYQGDLSITHFLYTEDDLLICRDNVDYWLKARSALRSLGFYASFVRYECKDGDDIALSTDALKRAYLSEQPHVSIGNDYAYVGLPQPYQGMYLLDRELMGEHMNGPSYDPDFGPWPIRETAAEGLTFASPPEGFGSRNLVGYNRTAQAIDPGSLVHHLPHNYANNPESMFGKVPIKELINAAPAMSEGRAR